MIEWSIRALRTGGCGDIVVAVPRDLLNQISQSLRGRSGVAFVAGGERRQDSVYQALQEVSSERVLVHDAARPLVSPDLVREVIGSLDTWDGVVVAVPVDETIKRVQGDQIQETVDRAGLWHAQTPQGFRTTVLRDAHTRARSDAFFATDDAALLERYGGRVCVVRGSRTNIKVTYPEDFALAGALAKTVAR